MRLKGLNPSRIDKKVSKKKKPLRIHFLHSRSQYYHPQNDRRFMLGCQKVISFPDLLWEGFVHERSGNEISQKGENGRDTEKRQRIQLNRLVSKFWRILSQNEKPEIFDENGRFPAETGGLESLTSE